MIHLVKYWGDVRHKAKGKNFSQVEIPDLVIWMHKSFQVTSDFSQAKIDERVKLLKKEGFVEVSEAEIGKLLEDSDALYQNWKNG